MKEKKIWGIVNNIAGSTLGLGFVLAHDLGISHFILFVFAVIIIAKIILLKKRDENTKEIIQESVKNFLTKQIINKFFNLILIKEMAEDIIKVLIFLIKNKNKSMNLKMKTILNKFLKFYF